MVAVARFDNDFYIRVFCGKVDEMGGGLEVVAEGGGGAAVFAVSDVEFLELLDSSCCHGGRWN